MLIENDDQFLEWVQERLWYVHKDWTPFDFDDPADLREVYYRLARTHGEDTNSDHMHSLFQIIQKRDAAPWRGTLQRYYDNRRD